MAQAKLIKCEQKENGIELFFTDLSGNEFSQMYTNSKLTFEQLNKMIGQQISFTDKEDGINIHKAWDRKTPTFCDDERHGFDR